MLTPRVMQANRAPGVEANAIAGSMLPQRNEKLESSCDSIIQTASAEFFGSTGTIGNRLLEPSIRGFLCCWIWVVASLSMAARSQRLTLALQPNGERRAH